MITPRQQLQNVLHILQQRPDNYWQFGVYWWPIKAMLKRVGYGPEELFYLGSYNDPETSAMVEPAGLKDTLEAAFAEQAFNATHPHPVPHQVEAPDGTLVTIWDADAGGL